MVFTLNFPIIQTVQKRQPIYRYDKSAALNKICILFYHTLHLADDLL